MSIAKLNAYVPPVEIGVECFICGETVVLGFA